MKYSLKCKCVAKLRFAKLAELVDRDNLGYRPFYKFSMFKSDPYVFYLQNIALIIKQLGTI